MAYQALHFMFEAWGVSSSFLLDVVRVENLVQDLVHWCGMSPLGQPVTVVIRGHPEKAWGDGVSTIQMLSDSHSSAHGVSGRGHIYVDVFSCDSLMDGHGLKRWLCRRLDVSAAQSRYRILDRTIVITGLENKGQGE